jgi:uncharacterized protein
VTFLVVVIGSLSALKAEAPTMLVHGEATVSVPPDIAQIDIGVISQAAVSEAAAQQNQKKSAVLARSTTSNRRA